MAENNQFERTCLTFGRENMEKIFASRVIVFGIGGVGSYVVEALARSGVGALDIVDDDTVCLSNLNRQLFALHSTVGKDKVDAAQERILDINPDCVVTKHKVFFTPETAGQFDFSLYDYVIDCIDTVTGKIAIILKAKEAGVPVISSMGAGNKVEPAKLQVADISKTSVCPLARVMRGELKKRGIKHLKCVFSTEKVIPPLQQNPQSGLGEEETAAHQKRQTPGSNAFVPSVAGLMIASEVLRDLTDFHTTKVF